MVLTVNTPTAARLRGAVQRADPAGSYAMPVVLQRPAGGDTPVLALDPARLRRIAGWGSARDTPAQAVLDRLPPADRPAPIRLTGNRLRLRVGNVSVTSDDPASSQRPQPVSLWLHVQLPDGSMTTVTLPVPTGRGPFASTGLLGGCAAGCTLSRIELVRSVGDFTSARVSLDLLELATGSTGRAGPGAARVPPVTGRTPTPRPQRPAPRRASRWPPSASRSCGCAPSATAPAPPCSTWTSR